MTAPNAKAQRDEGDVKNFFSQVKHSFDLNPFKSPFLLRGGHRQTLAGFAWPRRYRHQQPPVDEERLFELEADIYVLAHCRWQPDRTDHPTIVIWHGMEGSTASIYMIAMADKAFRAGFNIVRVNYRNCGGSEHLTPTLYHGGMSNDLRVVLNELISRDGLTRLFPIGFSLGGNMVLKLAAEYGNEPTPEIVAICVVSPAVDLLSSTDMLGQKQNWLYHQRFLRSMKRRIRIKEKLYPQLYDSSDLSSIHSIRAFDERYTARANGFADANDYYQRASSAKLAGRIRVPTLIIHAQDDPFILFAPLRDGAFVENPFLMLLSPAHGGHVAFVSTARKDEDRFWAENRAIEFCKLASAML